MTATTDDYSADTQTTGVLQINTKMRGNFETWGDRDWFKFQAVAGQHYNLVVSAGNGLVQSVYPYLHDAGGVMLGTDVQYGLFDPTSSGDYYLDLHGYQVGAYEVELRTVVDDYSSDDSNAGELTTGGQATGAIQYRGDSDRFKFSMEAGHFYAVELNIDKSAQGYGSLSCSGPGGAYVSNDVVTKADGTVRMLISPTVAGKYSINVQNNYTDAVVAYTLKAVSDQTDDYGDTIAGATAIELGAAASGVVESSRDIDMFKLDLVAGTTYGFVLQEGDNGSASNHTLNLNLSDSGGASVRSNIAGDGRAATFTPSVSGSYYAAVGNYQYADGTHYTLTTSLAADDYGDTMATAGALAIGAKLNGELEAGGGDRDMFAVALNAGATYWFTLTGAHEGNGTLSPSYSSDTVVLRDGLGHVVARSGQGVYNQTAPVLSYVPTAKGTYYLEVATSDRSVGTYQLQAQFGQRDDVGNDTAHAATLVEGVKQAGVLELPADTDVFKLSVVAGTTYGVQLSSAATTSASSYGLTLSAVDGHLGYVSLRTPYDPSGQAIRYFDASTSGDVYFTVASNGGALKGASYTLTATSFGRDDYTAGADTNGVLPVNGVFRGAIGVPDDHDWTKVHLEAGRAYVFELQGAQSGNGTLDTTLSGSGFTLMGANGSYLGQQSSGQGEPRLSYLATSTGDYFVDVHGNGQKTGTYALGVTMTTGDTTAPTLLSTAPAAAGLALSGKIVMNFSESVMLGRTDAVTLTDSTGDVRHLNAVYNNLSVIGHTLTIDPHTNLQPGMNYTLQLPSDSVLDLAGNAYSGPTSYSFTCGTVASSGGAGNDFLVGTGKGLAIDGGAGIDTVYYDDRSTYFQIQRDASGQTTVRQNGVFGGDTLTGVERLLFPTHAQALDIEGGGGQTYRLYQAAFNRGPDSGGLGYWIAARDHGATLKEVAQAFVDSGEFKGLYGAASSDADFVKLLYNNVLHRAPDAGGSDYWVTALHHGADRADLLVGFSESVENHATLAWLVGSGFSYTPFGG